MNKIISVSLAICLASCGGSTGGGSASQSSSSSVDSGWSTFSVEMLSSLPTCSANKIGRLYYIEDTGDFRACKTTGWEVIQVGNSEVSTSHCFKIVGSYDFVHTTTSFKNGDKFVTCSVGDLSLGTSKSFYRASDQGGSTTECALAFDIDTASGGWWEFRVVSGQRRATYKDTSSTQNNSVVDFVAGDCQM